MTFLTGENEDPYHLTISLEGNRLLFDVSNTADARIAREYLTVCKAYYASIKTSTPSKTEASARAGLYE